MSKKTRKDLRYFLTGFLCLLMVMILAIPSKATSEVQFSEKYLIGDMIEIPAIELKTDNGTTPAVAILHTPSGFTYKVQGDYEPVEAGLYRLEYVGYDSGGKRYSQNHSFTVVSPLYEVGSARSAVRFGEYMYGDVPVGRTAVLASVVSTDKFAYSQIIDLNALDEQSFLEFFVTPEKIGTNDVGKIKIVLTDIYDSENFVTITIKKGVAAQAGAAWAERTAYITANAANQQPTGLERGKGTLEIDETVYTLHKGDAWGANLTFALPGNPGYVSLEQPNNDPKKVASQSLAFRFDAENNRLYVNNQLVTMLSDPIIYGTDIWSGFTTGECLLTIEGADYNTSSLNLAITKIGSYSIGDSEEILKQNTFADTQAPTITVEVPESECPNGVEGVSYPLFAASAQDDYTSELKIKTEVYLHYGTQKQVRVDVRDGSFVPFADGVYTVVYSAVDRYGNVGTSKVEIMIEEQNTPLLSAQIAEATEGIAGQNYEVAIPQFQNAHGAVSWSAEAVHEDGSIRYDISSEDPVFFPEYAGNYILRYTYQDYIFTATEEKALYIRTNDTPVFFEEPVLPKALLYGCIYMLPEIDVRTYSAGEPMPAVPEIYVIEDGAAERKADYRYVSYAKESVQIIYRQENNGKTTEFRSDVLPVKDVGYNGTYKIDRYFDCDGFVVEARAKSIRFTPAAEDTQSATASFINPLQTFDFSIRFSGSGRGFEKINLYLTDIADPTVVLKLTYRLYKNAVYFSINDGEEQRLAGVSFNNPDSPIALNVQDNGVTVMPTGASTLRYTVQKDMEGKAFAGFFGNKAYLTVEVDSVTRQKQAGVDIFSICGQMISGIYVDNIKPMLSASAASGARPCGTEFVIPAVYYGDVLDPVAGCTMSVTAPDGSYAVSKDGILLDESADPAVDYTLPLTQHGSYTIHYLVKDTAGNELVFSYVITSADVIAPLVEILSPVTQGTVNTQIPVADIRITDNNDTQMDSFTIYVSVITPDDQTFALLDGAMNRTNHFTATSAGVYTVSYMVMDSGGNMTIASYEVTVR